MKKGGPHGTYSLNRRQAKLNRKGSEVIRKVLQERKHKKNEEEPFLFEPFLVNLESFLSPSSTTWNPLQLSILVNFPRSLLFLTLHPQNLYF